VSAKTRRKPGIKNRNKVLILAAGEFGENIVKKVLITILV